ncbi:MAG: hypothetical protein KC766_00870 [Myxococcales bacterium]|nr:hypothetical protein [Myxococcales bacterium]
MSWVVLLERLWSTRPVKIVAGRRSGPLKKAADVRWLDHVVLSGAVPEDVTSRRARAE